MEKTGACFGGHKKPLREWGHTHSLGFPFKNAVFSYVKTLGRVFWGIKNAAGSWRQQLLGFINLAAHFLLK
jgi:hypothetical protein